MVNWDNLGKFYAAFIIIWTVVLYAGVVWLVLNRHLTLVKIRNVPLSVAAVSFLHVYLVKICLAYITNGNFSCRAEFWIMSIYLPFGIALFQASLVQLRSVFDQQQSYLQYTPEAENSWPYQHVSGFWNYWRSRPKVQQAYVWIGIGMVFQVSNCFFFSHSCQGPILTPLSLFSLVFCTARHRSCKETGLALA